MKWKIRADSETKWSVLVWRSEQRDSLFNFGAHHGDIACVIARRFFLFVGSLVLLIDDNQPEIFQRCEHGTAGANDDPSAAGMDLMPFIMPFPLGQMTVQNRDGV